MHRHFENHSTYRFFTLYSMLHSRNVNIKLMKIGYLQIRMILDYLKYLDACNMIKCGEIAYEEIFSDDFSEICGTLTGVKMMYTTPPINALGIVFSKENKIKWCDYAARNGYFECFRFAHQVGSRLHKHICSLAVIGNCLGCLAYARIHGCQWDELTCTFAASYGHLEILHFVHSHGCPWDAMTCIAAAKNGYFECLKYAHQHGCLWNETVCIEAAKYGHLDCLEYAHINGCPIPDVWGSVHPSCAEYVEFIKNSHNSSLHFFAS